MKTVLYERHVALGAKIVQFSGWEMPVQYRGIIPEHHAVRQKAGIFDVSHMGRVVVEGHDAEKFLDYLSTNKIAGKPDLSATYTVWCNPNGGCVDDVIVYREGRNRFFVIVNAGNRQKDLEHLIQYSQGFDVKIQDRYVEDGILAVQGPNAIAVASKIFPEALSLKPMHFVPASYQDKALILSGTGYTGAGGIEIYAPLEIIGDLWDALLASGREEGILPVGLGARDTLRLEMGYALYGHEISDKIAPIESVSAWTVKWDKEDFLGKGSLERLQQSSTKRSEHGIVLVDRGIAREGYEVVQSGKRIGVVTSGTHSPTLNKSIAIVLSAKVLREGEEVEIKIRENLCKAKAVKLPFIHTKE